MRHIGRDLQRLSRPKLHVAARDVKHQPPRVYHRDLFILVMVQRDMTALFKLQQSDSHAGGMHHAAKEERGDFFERDLIPVVNSHRL